MKIYRKVDKKIFHFTIALIFIIGICSPSSISVADEELEDVGHSGGFIVKSEKIEGVMNAFEIMQGNVEIPEGQIIGLTITKKLAETEHGTLVINIKSPGPIPLDDLKAKSIGYPFFEELCESDNEEWLCMAGVEMTLSEQFANSIDLPNATVETCYEGQCADDREEELETMSLMLDDEKSIEEIEQDLESVNQILHVVEEELDNAQQTNKTIINDEQENQVNKSLEQFNEPVSEDNELLNRANEIHVSYSTFNEHASHFALSTAVIDDILKHVTHVLEQSNQAIEDLEESLSEKVEEISQQKQNKETLEAIDEHMELEESLEQLKETLKTLEEKIVAHQQTLDPLEQSSTTMMTKLNQYYESIQAKLKQIDEWDDNEYVQNIREALDVAEPAKEIEKQLQHILAGMTDKNLVEDTVKQENIIEEASEQATQSIVSISLAKEIGQLNEQIEEEIVEELETWEKQSEKLSELEEKFESLVQLAQLPETLVFEYELKVKLEENNKHDYRMQMLTNINKWKQWFELLSEKEEEIEQTITQYEHNQQSLEELVQVILASQQRYTNTELATIAQYLNIEAHLERERQISELIENGQQVMQDVEPMIKVTNEQLSQLEMKSSSLVEKVIIVNTLNDESFTEFVNVVSAFKQSVEQIEQPVKQLRNHFEIAEDLLGERVFEYTEFQEIQLVINTVEEMNGRLNRLIEELDALPYFEKIKEQVQELQNVWIRIDSMLQ